MTVKDHRQLFDEDHSIPEALRQLNPIHQEIYGRILLTLEICLNMTVVTVCPESIAMDTGYDLDEIKQATKKLANIGVLEPLQPSIMEGNYLARVRVPRRHPDAGFSDFNSFYEKN